MKALSLVKGLADVRTYLIPENLIGGINNDVALQVGKNNVGLGTQAFTALPPRGTTQSVIIQNWISSDNIAAIGASNYLVYPMPGNDTWFAVGATAYAIDSTPLYYLPTLRGVTYDSSINRFKVWQYTDNTFDDATKTLISECMPPQPDNASLRVFGCPTDVPDTMSLSEFRQGTMMILFQPWSHDDQGTVTTWAVNGYAQTDQMDWVYYLIKGSTLPDPPEPDEDPYGGDGTGYNPSDTGGGDGNGDPYDPGDPYPYPDNPPVSICDTGLISIYTPSDVQLNLLAADLWSSNFINSMVKDLYADPLDVIISLGIVPFNVTPAGTRNIKVGERDTGISSAYPSSNYYDFDMGAVNIDKIIGAYTDYAPYTRGTVFIPYVGYVPLDIDAFMGHSVGLKYKVDLCTGEAIAFLMLDDRVWQQYHCNLLIRIPLSAANYASMWQSLLGLTATLAGAGITAGAASGAATAGEAAKMTNKAVGQAAGAASDIMTSGATKPIIQKSNNLGVNASMLAKKEGCVILERANVARPTNQNKFIGYPSYINSKLSSLSGYTRVSSIHLGIVGATARELAEIEMTLKNGVVIKSHTPVTGSGIVLINNASANNVINKDMTLVGDLTGHFRDAVDIVNPIVRIERASAIGFNYVYIADFDRYYFVEEVKGLRNNMLELTLKCDPLQSFASSILSHDAIIDKQENNWNLYLNDDSIKTYQNPIESLWKFPNAFFTGYEYVLITAGS